MPGHGRGRDVGVEFALSLQLSRLSGAAKDGQGHADAKAQRGMNHVCRPRLEADGQLIPLFSALAANLCRYHHTRYTHCICRCSDGGRQPILCYLFEAILTTSPHLTLSHPAKSPLMIYQISDMQPIHEEELQTCKNITPLCTSNTSSKQ